MAEAQAERYIAMQVKSQDGKVTFFKIKRDTQLRKLLHSYCHKNSLNYRAVQFFIEGERFNDNKTPDELGLEDETEIDAMMHFGGGGVRRHPGCRARAKRYSYCQ